MTVDYTKEFEKAQHSNSPHTQPLTQVSEIKNTSTNPVREKFPTLNWGAFLLTWIWGVGNAVPAAFLALIPPFTPFIALLLLFKGNQWAWKRKRWRDLNHFKRVQTRWAIVGFTVWTIFPLTLMGLSYIGISSLKNSDIYQESYSKVINDPHVIELLGTPITPSLLINGNVHTSIDGSGTAHISYTLTGPKGSAKVKADGTKKEGSWTFDVLIVESKAAEKMFDLLGTGTKTPSQQPTPPPVPQQQNTTDFTPDVYDF